MSCQQVTRLITTNATTLSKTAAKSAIASTSSTPEDPYVFTETLPTTPPILFNAQKPRSRLTETHLATSLKTPINQKLPLAQLNDNINKNQASTVNVFHAVASTVGTGGGVGATAVTVNATTKQFKNVTQSQKLQQKRFTTNVCVVRPQLQPQKQQQHNQTSHHKQLKQQKQQQQKQPPPLLSHTPSLWQTPLLLDTNSPTLVSVSPQNSPVAAVALLSPKATPIVATAAVATATVNTATTALVSPLISTTALHTSTLPPSKFHHNTLAQHLQKLQCIKKPKKADAASNLLQTQQLQLQLQQPPLTMPQQPQTGVDKESSKLLTSQTIPPPLQAFTTGVPSGASQHSDPSDPNEIPVNVIFRKPQITSEITRTLLNAGAASGPSGAGVAVVSGNKSGTEAPEGTWKKQSHPIAVSKPTVSSPVNKLKNVKIIAPSPKVVSHQAVASVEIKGPVLPPAQGTAILKDVVFVQPLAKTDNALSLSGSEASSKALTTSKANADCAAAGVPALIKTSTPLACPTATTLKTEKVLQPAALHTTAMQSSSPPPLLKVSAAARKTVSSKRKSSKLISSNATTKRSRCKSFSTLFQNESTLSDISSTAVAVVKLSAEQVAADTSLLATAAVLPYCVQRHWLNVCDLKALAHISPPVPPQMEREHRIAQHKHLLRRQAMQLLATRPLQRLPLHGARRRLMCVDRLLRKYRNHAMENDRPIKKCAANACNSPVLELTSYCRQHIGSNISQQLFLPCTAKFADNTQCRIPVFDISHDLPLCAEHARKRDAYNRQLCEQRPRKLPLHLGIASASAVLTGQPKMEQQKALSQQLPMNCYGKKAVTTAITSTRKRKAGNASGTAGGNTNPVGRPQKRSKKSTTAATALSQSPPLVPLSAVLQRKSSTTSLESIASNSYSSSSQPLLLQQEQIHNTLPNSTLCPPALAPLSGFGSCVIGHSQPSFANSSSVTAAANEINEIVTQLAMVSASNSNSNSKNNYSSPHLVNTNTNSNSNFTSGLGSSSSLPSATDELLTQDMLSICENSSAYASSEDTGLGGLSESELMTGAPDADEIPLSDARFFFDDLANVINAMPADAFNELFTTVQQDEREEVERALEHVDKHLKALQQTIASDSDFLGDFLDVNEDMLPDADICSKMEIVSSVMHSPETSNIDSGTLFMDNSTSNAAGAATNTKSNCTTVADVRGLVQT